MNYPKFRAWHKGMKKMFSAEEMGKDQMTLSVDGRGFVNVSGVSTKLSEFYEEVMIPLQCTYLKDKNGVEIYQGDILANREIHKDNFYCVVGDLNNGLFCAETIPNRKYNRPLYNMMHDEGAKYNEIIGNIYEDVELIRLKL